jgi:hypothetical protein
MKLRLFTVALHSKRKNNSQQVPLSFSIFLSFTANCCASITVIAGAQTKQQQQKAY